jgi:quinol monooxygenase YgiN
MVIVIGRGRCAPGKRDELVEAMRWMQGESRQEPGCLRYGFYTSVEDPDEFVAVEEWESGEALRAHFAAPSIAEFGARVGGLIGGAPEVRIHGIAASNDYPDLDGLA